MKLAAVCEGKRKNQSFRNRIDDGEVQRSQSIHLPWFLPLFRTLHHNNHIAGSNRPHFYSTTTRNLSNLYRLAVLQLQDLYRHHYKLPLPQFFDISITRFIRSSPRMEDALNEADK